MLSRAQQILLKTAQRDAGLDDAEYRATLQRFFGVRSSTDPALGDDALDVMLAYLEAVYWRGVDSGAVQPSCKPAAPFRQRGYWAAKNPAANTSRDRYEGAGLQADIQEAEAALHRLGCSPAYIAAIRDKVCRGRFTPPQQRAFRAALQRTLAARQGKRLQAVPVKSSPPSEDPQW